MCQNIKCTKFKPVKSDLVVKITLFRHDTRSTKMSFITISLSFIQFQIFKKEISS